MCGRTKIPMSVDDKQQVFTYTTRRRRFEIISGFERREMIFQEDARYGGAVTLRILSRTSA